MFFPKITEHNEGLLPAQNECRLILRAAYRYRNIVLFPDGVSKKVFAQSTEKLQSYLNEKNQEFSKKTTSGIDCGNAACFIHLFCQELDKTPLDYPQIQDLFSTALAEAFDHFFDIVAAGMRWTRTSFTTATNDVLLADILTNAVRLCFKEKIDIDGLDALSQKLMLASLCLISTDFDEQIALAAHDLAVSQNQINKSMRIIAGCSMIIATVSLLVTLVPLSAGSGTQMNHESGQPSPSLAIMESDLK